MLRCWIQIRQAAISNEHININCRRGAQDRNNVPEQVSRKRTTWGKKTHTKQFIC